MLKQKQILLVPSSLVPIPPVKGGAVQGLIQEYINHNEITKKYELHVLSISDSRINELHFNFKNTKFHYIKHNILIKIRNTEKKPFSSFAFHLLEFLYYHKLYKLVKSLDDDALVVLENTPKYYKKISRLCNKKKVIIHLYNDLLNSNIPNSKFICNNVDKIITVSRFNAKIIEDICDPNKIEVVYNGVDINKFDNNNKESIRKEMRKKYNIDDNTTVFIFVARLVKEKGIEELLESFVNICNNYDCKLIVVGNKLYGENLVTPFLKKLYAISKKSKDKIIFTGHVDYDLLPQYYFMSDVGILPSLYDEPFSLSAIEYMASGLAVIVSDAGGFPEMIGDTGVIVRRENLIRNLENTMIKLMIDKDLRRKLSKKSKKRSEQYSIINYCIELDKIYDDM